mmetsp:Transcript_38465/g.86636  ORF Transcript_38465/g.86636 Transcript_38465/m.86636 type:complete len:246 (+) Transcript_38465:1989-2726(+)
MEQKSAAPATFRGSPDAAARTASTTVPASRAERWGRRSDRSLWSSRGAERGETWSSHGGRSAAGLDGSEDGRGGPDGGSAPPDVADDSAAGTSDSRTTDAKKNGLSLGSSEAGVSSGTGRWFLPRCFSSASARQRSSSASCIRHAAGAPPGTPSPPKSSWRSTSLNCRCGRSKVNSPRGDVADAVVPSSGPPPPGDESTYRSADPRLLLGAAGGTAPPTRGPADAAAVDADTPFLVRRARPIGEW